MKSDRHADILYSSNTTDCLTGLSQDILAPDSHGDYTVSFVSNFMDNSTVKEL